MFLNSYPPEEAAIDKLLFRKPEGKPRSTYRITPEYEWEAKNCLSAHVAEINMLRSSGLDNPTKKARREETPGISAVHSLLTVKAMKQSHIPTEYYNIISACHNSDVGHWGIEETITKVKEYLERHKYKFKDLVWTTLRKDVDNIIKRCPCCQLNRDLKFQINTKS